MSGVAVVTDTTQYLPQEVVERHGLSLVSLYVNWDGRTDRESEMPGFDAFYDFLKRGEGDLPSTSQPSVGDFLAVYEPLLERGDDIVSIHLSGGISGTVRSAEQARDALVERGVDAERIVVLDSRTAPPGHGLMASPPTTPPGGATAGAAADAPAKLGERMTILFAVDTLEYLRRGGRIGAAQALLGSALKIKPILSIDSEITPVERVRTPGRAFDRLVRELEEQREDGADVFFIQHVQAPELAERLAERGREIYGRRPGVRVGDRARDRHPHRARAGRRDGAAVGAARPVWRRRRQDSARRGANHPRVSAPAAAPSPTPALDRARSCGVVLTVLVVRAGAVPDLPAAQAADVDLHRRLPRDRAVGPGELPAAPDARGVAVAIVYLGLILVPVLIIGGAGPADRHAGQQPRPDAARVRARPDGLRRRRTTGCASSRRTTTSPASSRSRPRSSPRGSATRPACSATSGSASSTRSSPRSRSSC